MNNKELEIGFFRKNLHLVLNHLKQDLKDDWFQDPIQFSDKLNENEIVEYFNNNIKENLGVYKPQMRIELNLPKQQGTLRYELYTNFYDRIAFHAFGLTLIENLDEFIPRRVFNHRLNRKDILKTDSKYLFYNSIDQWKKFEEFVRIDAKDKTVLITDVQNYYEHIQLNILKDNLFCLLERKNTDGNSLSIIRFCIESLCHCLTFWGFSETNGLPQNKDISSFLANVYMFNIDEFLINKNIDYYRYMDDIRILCSDKYEARFLIKLLTTKLRENHLTLNGSKTEILYKPMKQYEEFLAEKNIELERIEAMFHSKKKAIVAQAFEKVKEKIESLFEEEDYLSRKFRFYIRRLSKIARCSDIEKPANYYNKIKSKLFSALVENPTAMDQFYELLSSIKLSKNDLNKLAMLFLNKKIFIYSWQNYYLWKLFIYHNFINRKLLHHAKDTVKHHSSQKPADVAGASLYIGKFGNKKNKINLAKVVTISKNHFINRHILIAIQDLKFSEIKFIKDHVSKENNGTYRYLNSQKRPIYVSPLPEIKYNELIKEIGFYV